MKNTKNIILVMFVALLAVSCSKEETITSQKDVNENSLQFLLNGERLIGMNDIEWTDETHFVSLGDENLVFDTDEAFLNWTKSSIEYNDFAIKLEEMHIHQKMAIETGIIDDEEATFAYMESVNNASSSRAGHNLLFDKTNHLGTFLGLYRFNPKIPTKMRNRAESIITNGIGAMCDKTWFKGAKYWYWGLPIKNLGWFNNRAESIF